MSLTPSDQLNALLSEHVNYWDHDHRAAVHAVIAEGWRPPPRVITDPAVADQLPAGTVVITDGGQVAQRYDGMGGWWQILDGDQWESADLIGDGHIVVLHEPEEGDRD